MSEEQLVAWADAHRSTVDGLCDVYGIDTTVLSRAEVAGIAFDLLHGGG